MQGLSAGAHVGVIGRGAMGAGIAQVAAFAGHPVVVLEVDRGRAAAAAAGVVTAAERRAEPIGGVVRVGPDSPLRLRG